MMKKLISLITKFFTRTMSAQKKTEKTEKYLPAGRVYFFLNVLTWRLNNGTLRNSDDLREIAELTLTAKNLTPNGIAPLSQVKELLFELKQRLDNGILLTHDELEKIIRKAFKLKEDDTE